MTEGQSLYERDRLGEECSRNPREFFPFGARLVAPIPVGDELDVGLPWEVDPVPELEPEHLAARERLVTLLTQLEPLTAPRIYGRRVIGQRAEGLEIVVREASDDLAVIGMRLCRPRWGHDAHRPVTPTRRVHRDLSEGEADLFVDRGES